MTAPLIARTINSPANTDWRVDIIFPSGFQPCYPPAIVLGTICRARMPVNPKKIDATKRTLRRDDYAPIAGMSFQKGVGTERGFGPCAPAQEQRGSHCSLPPAGELAARIIRGIGLV